MLEVKGITETFKLSLSSFGLIKNYILLKLKSNEKEKAKIYANSNNNNSDTNSNTNSKTIAFNRNEIVTIKMKIL